MKNIAIIMGGYSSEVEISLKSGNVVYNNLNRALYKPYRVHILKEKWVVLDDNDMEFPINKHDFSTEINNKKITFDCVFNAIHGSPGENGVILAYFQLLGIKHTSAPFYQMALTFNKRDTLSVVKAYGIKTATSVYLNQGDTINENEIFEKVGLPCFVKPNNAGSSFGISKVSKKEDLKKAIEKAFAEDSELLIESFLDGTEVSIGVIEYEGKLKVLAPTEIVSENDFFDYEAKYLGKSQEITPARISETKLKNLNSVAKKVYKALGMKGFSRAEYIFIGDEPYFIEINTVPGLTSNSLLPMQAKEAGIPLDKLFSNAIEEALK
ncbi:D-alanine--D-alanine ligase [Aureibaculum marinum]|uniref:D-alanine--D-alanine ligase n=1 Tax=Aureibaculum marinum TaxID=2487930 RepID=A0A3N4NZC7_9FLAO|nr:D-alanine--D-alanine ligase [Aureibaculum marinum]RPD98186.1 D-alanine--D-alanine ligase [Aureibaculum marinum]